VQSSRKISNYELKMKETTLNSIFSNLACSLIIQRSDEDFRTILVHCIVPIRCNLCENIKFFSFDLVELFLSDEWNDISRKTHMKLEWFFNSFRSHKRPETQTFTLDLIATILSGNIGSIGLPCISLRTLFF